MAYTINNFDDFEKFVKAYFDSDRSELDSIGRLQYDFMYSMPQKIEAAKNSLRGNSEMEGTLRMLEEAEELMKQSYEEYAQHVPEYFTATHGMAVLSQSIQKGILDVSISASKQIYDKCAELERAHKKYGVNLVNVYGIINSIIDGKGAQYTVIDDLKKYGFYDEYTTRDHTVEELDGKLMRTAGTLRYQLINKIGNAVRNKQHMLSDDQLPLVTSHSEFDLMENHQPLKLSPEKAVLHLDKLEMNMGALDLNNYSTLLDSNKAVAGEWARQCFANMFNGIYNSSELEQMEQDGIDPLDGVYIDGKPISELYGDVISEERPLKAAQTILEGDHTLTVCRLERRENGSYVKGEALKGEVRTELEEHISLWHRLLRWLGIEKTKVSRLTAGDLEAEEAVEKINHRNSNKELSDTIKIFDANVLNADRVFFKANVPADIQNVDSYINNLSMYNDEEGPSYIVSTMYRSPTRGHLAVLYMLSQGMSLEDALSADPSLDEQKKQLGKQFIDTISVLDPEGFAAENGISVDEDGFEDSYTDYCREKKANIIAMYNDKLFPAQRILDGMIPELDINNTQQLIDVYPAIAMCVYGSLDAVQSLSNTAKSFPEDTITQQNINRTSTSKCYGIVLNYYRDKANALSAEGMTDPKSAFKALMAKACAERFTNELNGKAPEQKLSIQASYARITDWSNVSARAKANMLSDEDARAIHQGLIDSLKSSRPVPKVAADFIENIFKGRFNNEGTAIFPVSDKELVAQFTATDEKKSPTLTRSKGM